MSGMEERVLGEPQVQTTLVVFYPHPSDSEAHLAWKVQLIPHLAARDEYMVDALSGEVLRTLDHLCHLLPPIS
ncbi:MAG: hypothetical protein R2795_12885 [Saprospiraceae bacterium]